MLTAGAGQDHSAAWPETGHLYRAESRVKRAVTELAVKVRSPGEKCPVGFEGEIMLASCCDCADSAGRPKADHLKGRISCCSGAIPKLAIEIRAPCQDCAV